MVMEGVWMRSASPMVTDHGVGESEGVRQCMRFGKLIPFSGKSADSFISHPFVFYVLPKGFFWKCPETNRADKEKSYGKGNAQVGRRRKNGGFWY